MAPRESHDSFSDATRRKHCESAKYFAQTRDWGELGCPRVTISPPSCASPSRPEAICNSILRGQRNWGEEGIRPMNNNSKSKRPELKQPKLKTGAVALSPSH
jgi:hypothetical protein